METIDKHLFLLITYLQGLPSVCEFLAFRHFFKANVGQSVAELVLYSQKTRNVVIFYQTKTQKCKHDKTEIYFKRLSAAHILGNPCLQGVPPPSGKKFGFRQCSRSGWIGGWWTFHPKHLHSVRPRRLGLNEIF